MTSPDTLREGVGWGVYQPEDDPAGIAWRRFGPAYERKCVRPEVLLCARVGCQRLNRCQYEPADRATAEKALEWGREG